MAWAFGWAVAAVRLGAGCLQDLEEEGEAPARDRTAGGWPCKQGGSCTSMAPPSLHPGILGQEEQRTPPTDTYLTTPTHPFPSSTYHYLPKTNRHQTLPCYFPWQHVPSSPCACPIFLLLFPHTFSSLCNLDLITGPRLVYRHSSWFPSVLVFPAPCPTPVAHPRLAASFLPCLFVPLLACPLAPCMCTLPACTPPCAALPKNLGCLVCA